MKKKEINYISAQGYRKFSEEIDNLVKKERPEVTKIVTWAAGNGDRSENADYQYGKKRLREIDRRLRFLRTRLNLAQIVDPLELAKNGIKEIKFSATVELIDENEVRKCVTIVGVDEVDLAKNRISWKSPLGTSLLGKKEGDCVLVQTPKGDEIEYEVKKINYQEIKD